MLKANPNIAGVFVEPI